MRIYVNGSPVEVEEDSTITVTNEPETEAEEVKESKLSKAKNWISNHKLLTAGGAVAGYCALKKLFSSTDEDEEDEEETETEPEEEETEE